MSALAHFIERAGVATVCISLVREQTEKVNPPRALWVPFPLGRPVGVPGDADFQKDVMRAAFAMLETATEPTIDDYPHEAPEAGPEQWACPLNLGTPSDDTLGARLTAEVGRLRPWAAETRRRRRRTTFGLSGAAAVRWTDEGWSFGVHGRLGEVYRPTALDLDAALNLSAPATAQLGGQLSWATAPGRWGLAYDATALRDLAGPRLDGVGDRDQFEAGLRRCGGRPLRVPASHVAGADDGEAQTAHAGPP